METERGRFTDPPYDEQWQTEALRKSGLELGRRCLDLPPLDQRQRGPRRTPPRTDADKVNDYRIHPGLIDCGFQVLGALLPGAGEGIDAYLPMSVERLRLYDHSSAPAWCTVSLRELKGDVALGDIQLVDASGRVVRNSKVCGCTGCPARLVGPPAGRAASRLVSRWLGRRSRWRLLRPVPAKARPGAG